MAFSQATTNQTVFGNKRIVYGTYNGAAVTTGELATGLAVTEMLVLTGTGASVVADAPTVNETFPNTNSTQTLIFTSGTTGVWMAIGLA